MTEADSGGWRPTTSQIDFPPLPRNPRQMLCETARPCQSAVYIRSPSGRGDSSTWASSALGRVLRNPPRLARARAHGDKPRAQAPWWLPAACAAPPEAPSRWLRKVEATGAPRRQKKQDAALLLGRTRRVVGDVVAARKVPASSHAPRDSIYCWPAAAPNLGCFVRACGIRCLRLLCNPWGRR